MKNEKQSEDKGFVHPLEACACEYEEFYVFLDRLLTSIHLFTHHPDMSIRKVALQAIIEQVEDEV